MELVRLGGMGRQVGHLFPAGLAAVGVFGGGTPGFWRQKGQVPAADLRRLERGIESVSAVVLRFVDLIVGR